MCEQGLKHGNMGLGAGLVTLFYESNCRVSSDTAKLLVRLLIRVDTHQTVITLIQIYDLFELQRGVVRILLLLFGNGVNQQYKSAAP